MNIADLKIPDIDSLHSFLIEKAPADSPFKEERRKELIGAILKAKFTYYLNPVYILAHAIHESGWGRSKIAKEKNNIFGYKAYDSSPFKSAMIFKNYDDCVNTVMGAVKKEYLTPGGKYYNEATLEGMNVRYATDRNWNKNIRKLMNEIYNHIGKRG